MKLFNSFDRFTKIFIITAILIAIATPFIANQYQIFNPQATTLPPEGGSSALKCPCKFRFYGEHTEPTCGYGDVNLDGVVTISDSQVISRMLSNLSVNIPSSKLKYAYEAADVNGEPYKRSYKIVAYINGEPQYQPVGLDIGDAQRIARYVAKLDQSFPACHYIISTEPLEVN